MDRVLCLLIFILTGFARFAKYFAALGIGSYEEWKPGRKRKLLLVGYNGARNTGSDVRVAAIAKQIRELFGKEQVHITVMTLDAASLSGYFDDDVELLSFSSFFPFDLYRACCTHHAAILCEGSTLKSTFANALTLFLCEAAGIMRSQNKPCLAYGSEVGQMEPFLFRAAGRLCTDTYFITRTQDSLIALKKLGLQGHAGTDAAWNYDGAISTEETKRLLTAHGWDGVKPLLGIAVIDPFCWPVRASILKWIKGKLTGDQSDQYDRWYYYSDSPERRAAYRRYIKEISVGVNAFLKNNDYYPVLIGMEQLDEKACTDLRGRLTAQSAMFLSGEYSAHIMTGVLRELSILVTSRYHAAVLSMEKGCPIVAVSMDERLDGLMKDLSFDRTCLLHVDDKDLGIYLRRELAAADKHRSIIREEIRMRTVQYKQELADMGAFMEDYIRTKLRGNTGRFERKEVS